MQGTFYDLGSGTGKCTIAAALTLKFNKIMGVELLDGLYYESVRMTDILTKKCQLEV